MPALCMLASMKSTSLLKVGKCCSRSLTANSAIVRGALLLACGAGGGETGNIEVVKGTRLNFSCILFDIVVPGAGAGVLSFSATVIFSGIGAVNKTLGSLIGF